MIRRRRRYRRQAATLLRSRSCGRILAALAVLLVSCGADDPDADGRRPAAAVQAASEPAALNVLLITIDTLRADALGAYDSSRRTSPNIDRLAAEGVLFEQCVTSQPSTLPSHASIMTGTQPFAHGVRSNYGYVLAAENVTLAEILRDAGYTTAAEIAAPVIGRRTQLDQGFARYGDLDSYAVRLKKVPTASSDGREQREIQQRDAEDITRRGIEFLRRQGGDRFFLWLHYFDPHTPYAAPPRLAARFSNPYLAEVAYVDAQIGRLRAELERLGLVGQTLIVLTSDHGEGLGEHGEETHSFLVYDSTMRVPLILWGAPDLPAGRRVDALVRTVDVAPSVLHWLGLPEPEGMQGVPLRALAVGGFWGAQLTGYGESIESYATFGTSILRFVREGRWKYIHKVEPELYDVLKDPGERSNRAQLEPQVSDRLRARLRELVAQATPVADAEAEIDAQTLAQLDALGYVGSATPMRIHDELATLEVAGVDPSQALADITRYADAWGALMTEGRPEKAAGLFRALSERYPESLPIHRGLVESLLESERRDEAILVLRRALELAPDNVELRLVLAEQVRLRGGYEEAERLLRSGLADAPCTDGPRVRLSNLLHEQKRYADQMALLGEGVEQCPEAQSFRNDYAYARATSPDPALRDGAEALRIAREIAQGDGAANPAILDTLAAAYAETGDFTRAIATSRRALELVESRDVPEEAAALFRGHLETLESGQPIREE